MLTATHKDICVFCLSVVKRIVHHIIDYVADHEAGKDRWKPLRPSQENVEDEVEEPKEHYGQRNADNRGHDKSGPAERLRVVHPVGKEEDPLKPLCAGMIVEKEPMQEILGKSPDQPARQNP
jgi:hypothetical protein